MRTWRRVLLWALLQSIVVLAHNDFHNTTDRHVENKASNYILLKLWKREISCPEDEYQFGTLCCKRCSTGKYVESDCKENHGDPECKDCIEGSTYMDKKNGYHECHKCLQCDTELGQETLWACTVSQNTACKCAKDFFCPENGTVEIDGCKQCKHCTTCEYHYAETCTAARDAVCKPRRNHYLLIIAAFAVSISFLGILCCVRHRPDADNHSQSRPPVLPDEFKDIDLTDHLLQFSEQMDFCTVLWFVRTKKLPDPTIDAIQRDYKDHSEEQKYQLLKEWYKRHGRVGAFQGLINTLKKKNRNQVAEQLIQIVESHSQQSQG